MDIEQIKLYLGNCQKVSFDINIIAQLKELKGTAIESSNEEVANEIWCLETISEIQRLFISAYNSIKNAKHLDAWCLYELIDIKFSILRRHFDYSSNKYNLEFVEEYSRKYAKLFPYRYFLSREAIIKKESCSICGKVNTIRDRCEHEVGELYMGEMCERIVEDMEFLAFAIVTNPFDKYTVITPKDMEYNYEALDTLFSGLNTPNDRWNLNIHEKIKPEFENAKRNRPCPCGSGKKYKRCCSDTHAEKTVHYEITLLDNPNAEPVPYKILDTWK